MAGGIRRLQKGYEPIGSFTPQHGTRIDRSYCPRCEEQYQTKAPLGSRIMPMDKMTGKPIPKPPDYDQFLECRNCGTIYPKYNVRQEPLIEPIVKSRMNPFSSKDSTKGVDKGKKKRKGKRGENPRVRNTREEVKDPDVKREMRQGNKLISYSET